MEDPEELFEPYVDEMRQAMVAAQAWWRALLEREGEDAVLRRWPLGPVSHPFVIATYRKWSLAVQKVDEDVEPREIVIEMLSDRAEDVAEFMAEFVFDPVGLDKDDRWV